MDGTWHRTRYGGALGTTPGLTQSRGDKCHYGITEKPLVPCSFHSTEPSALPPAMAWLAGGGAETSPVVQDSTQAPPLPQRAAGVRGAYAGE